MTDAGPPVPIRTVPAGACDECRHPVGGMIVALEPNPHVLCDVCAEAALPPSVYVKPRRDHSQRWYPGRGYDDRMYP